MAAKRVFLLPAIFLNKKEAARKKLLLREYYDNLGGDFVKKENIFFGYYWEE